MKSEYQTVIIPVKYNDKEQYVIKIAKPLWNEMQIFILEGAVKKKIVVEFEIER